MIDKVGAYRLLQNENGYWLLLTTDTCKDLSNTGLLTHIPVTKETFELLSGDGSLNERKSVKAIARAYKQNGGDWNKAIALCTTPIVT